LSTRIKDKKAAKLFNQETDIVVTAVKSVLQTYAINGTLANAIKSYLVSGEILVELGSFIRKFYPNLEVFPLSNLPELLDNLVSAESLKI
jgi:hypothetical protein